MSFWRQFHLIGCKIGYLICYVVQKMLTLHSTKHYNYSVCCFWEGHLCNIPTNQLTFSATMKDCVWSVKGGHWTLGQSLNGWSFLDTVNVINARLCMTLILTDLTWSYCFWVTLTWFQSEGGVITVWNKKWYFSVSHYVISSDFVYYTIIHSEYIGMCDLGYIFKGDNSCGFLPHQKPL